MIEDKFGAELLGLQLPVSSLGRLPPLQAAEALASLCLHPALLKLPGLLSLPPPGQEALGLGGLGSPWPREGASHHPPRVSRTRSSSPPVLCPALLSLPTRLHLSPHQQVAQLRYSVPTPSWSLPNLPTPTGRSTAGKRAPGPPDQTAPAVLLKVRGTQRWAVGPGFSTLKAQLFSW